MGKQIAPTYSSWDLHSFSPYLAGSHYVVTESAEEATPIDEQRVVVDYGVQEKRDQAIAAAAQNEAKRLNQESFDLHIKGKKFDRFVIGHSYVTVVKSDVARLAGIFDTPLDAIKITHDLEILHRTGEWIFWSDGRFTTSIGCTIPNGGSLSPAAISLISAVRGSDGGGCNLPGGLRKLARVAKILSEEDVEAGPSRGHYARERIQRMVIEWNDGTTGELFVHTAGYFEGYLFDIYPDLDALKAQIAPAPGPEGIRVFPTDDYAYDPTLGYVAVSQEE